jgi:hypothetical protein
MPRSLPSVDSARHNTIRTRVATEADTSALFTSAANSAR